MCVYDWSAGKINVLLEQWRELRLDRFEAVGVLELLSFSRIKKQTIEAIVSKAKALGYDLESEEVGSRQSETGHWLIMPKILHKWSVVYEDGYPVDKERATLAFMHVRQNHKVAFTNVQSRGLFNPTIPKPEPDGYEIVMLEWSLVAVVSPEGAVTWGKTALDDLVTRVLHGSIEENKISRALQSQINDRLSIRWLSLDGQEAKNRED